MLMLAFLVTLAGGGEPAFVGSARCKVCHRAIYLSWAATAHARAGRRLSDAERTPRCTICHAAGGVDPAGVECEACHGAGGNYWPAEVMMDPWKAREAGLLEPSEKLCRTCHGATDIPGHAPGFAMPGLPSARFVH
jgi:hypothetical protein